jgi:hypothetical protein
VAPPPTAVVTPDVPAADTPAPAPTAVAPLPADTGAVIAPLPSDNTIPGKCFFLATQCELI